MTTIELKSKIRTSFSRYGHFKVIIEFRGKMYTHTTTNTMAIDKIDDSRITKKSYYVSEKQALKSLWDECKRANNLM